MSFDIILTTHNTTGEMRDFTNPFTGEAVHGPVHADISETERRAISELLATVAPKGANEYGCFVLELSDGGKAEVFASELPDDKPFFGCMIAIRRHFTPLLLDTIWRLCNMGRMSMFATMDDSKPIVTDKEHLSLLPDDWDDAVVCDSPEQLGLLLDKGFSDWDKLRNTVGTAG